MTIAERLRQARLEAGFKTLVEFQMALPVGTRGSSYSSIRAFERGLAAPPEEFLTVAAPILGVRAEWLALGQGPRTTGEAATAQLRDEENKAPLSKALWALLNEVLHAYTKVPGPALRLMQDLIFDLYYQRGPEAFGVEYPGEWKGFVSAREAFPEILITPDDIHRYFESRLGSVLFDAPVASYGEHVSQWLSAFSVLYLQEFGSKR